MRWPRFEVQFVRFSVPETAVAFENWIVKNLAAVIAAHRIIVTGRSLVALVYLWGTSSIEYASFKLILQNLAQWLASLCAVIGWKTMSIITAFTISYSKRSCNHWLILAALFLNYRLWLGRHVAGFTLQSCSFWCDLVLCNHSNQVCLTSHWWWSSISHQLSKK